MTYRQYYRGALHVPIVLPVGAWVVLTVALLFEQAGFGLWPPGWMPTWLGVWLATLVLALSYGGGLYLVPYLFAFGLIWRRSTHWQARQFRWALVAVPLAFAIGAGLVAFLVNLAFEPTNPLQVAWRWSSVALIVGGAQALLIGFGDVVGSTLGWFEGSAISIDERVA